MRSLLNQLYRSRSPSPPPSPSYSPSLPNNGTTQQDNHYQLTNGNVDNSTLHAPQYSHFVHNHEYPTDYYFHYPPSQPDLNYPATSPSAPTPSHGAHHTHTPAPTPIPPSPSPSPAPGPATPTPRSRSSQALSSLYLELDEGDGDVMFRLDYLVHPRMALQLLTIVQERENKKLTQLLKNGIKTRKLEKERENYLKNEIAKGKEREQACIFK